MNHKKVDLYFEDCLSQIEIELHDSDSYSICVTEFQVNEQKSTSKTTHYEPRHTTEVFVGQDEMKSIVNAMNFLIKEDEES